MNADAERLPSLVATATTAMRIGVALVYLLAATGLAIAIPFHAWDALALGAWSRLIAASGELHVPDLGAWFYQRPLFYALQGALWRAIGFHESAGRLLALAFTLLLVAALVALARTQGGRERAWVTVLLLLSVPDVAEGAIAGLTDAPVAALVGLTAWLVWMPDERWWRLPAIVVAAACAGLTKPSAFPSLVGLAAAVLVGRRAELRGRLRRGAIPIGVGVLVALAWHAEEARMLGMPLLDFLRTGTTGFYSDLARGERRDALLRMDWLGHGVTPTAVFAAVYALLHVAGAVPRRAAVVALTTALGLWSVSLGISRSSWGAWERLDAVAGLVLLLTTAAMLTRGAFHVRQPDSVHGLLRLVVWAAPGFASWVVVGPYASRLLSSAWPPLVLLIASVLTPLFTSTRVAVRLPIVASLVLVVLAGVNLRHLDRGWGIRKLPAFVASDFDRRLVRRTVLGPFADAVDIVRQELGDDGRLFASDGRFAFFFPGRQTSRYPRTCGELAGHRAFVLSIDAVARTVQEEYVGASGDPTYWERCATPELQEIARVGEFVIFRVRRAAS